MNDRYLYRAKHVHAFDVNKKHDGWVYGFLSCENYIYSPELGAEKLIDPSTICQCTGLKDKNGKLIWENDICIITDGTLDEEDGYFRLDWEIDRAMFEFEGTGICANFDNVSGYDCEVVGNIFDNPELLEVGE